MNITAITLQFRLEKLHLFHSFRILAIISNSKNIVMKNKKYLIPFTAMLFLLGCTDSSVIDLPLEDLSGKVVIEGNVTDKNGPYQVKVTRSDKTTQTTNPQPVSNAVVVISDNHGQSDVLQYNNGIYKTVNLTTHYGDTYTLSVTVDGVTYKAESKMPENVEFTDLKQKNTYDYGYVERKLIPIFKDPDVKGNYYLFRVDGYYNSKFTLFSDYTGNGEVNGRALNNSGFLKGSKVKVEMQCIDETVYNYFNALSKLSSDNTINNLTPVNPPSNISNGALGYFSAHTSSEREIIIQD
ncbi:hypothetical protein CQ046_00105 [Chryseobacterium sp. MYb7]|nr:hypothetical protein CQ046_00105 [Chryseobacterium sp. MYb7]